ncbi:hypothetical protein Cgig2_025576 [Carnegiea gigantea]|uniref:photosystem I n=1 Tax=Carnegiea gigantea TaxID=171969 RepID=A0A9Q1Q9U5_9CARY|nr:hypothetical protein Cgig2_025576 [Carnegiea gigantea]
MAPGATTSIIAVDGKVALLPIQLGTADFLVHHIHAFTIHVIVLILLKGVLFARSYRLIPDKANLGFHFPCDGPGRGGTCQVSTWDHSDVWGNISDQGVVTHITGGNFAQSSITINGWLRDFLWAQASQQELIESIVWAHNKLKVAPATQPRALSIVQGRAVGVTHYLLGGIATTWAFFLARIIAEDLKGILALRFPRFSQGLAQDPTTRRIWFGITTAHDFKNHDDITEERIYQNIFASHFGQLAIIFLWTSGNLFHVAWQGNFESWVRDPLHWWYIISLRSNEDLYSGALFLLFLSVISLLGGWLHLQPKWKPSISWFKNAESRLNHHLSGLFGVSSLAWTGHLVHVAILGSREEYVRWNNFLDILPHPQELGPLFTGQWNLSQNPNSSSHLFGLALASLRVIPSLVAQHIYSLPAYAFIAQDFTTQVALYTHHQYIEGFIMTGAFAHGAIFFIRDYNPKQNGDNVLARMLDHKEAITSHLSWACLFLGFHTLGLYVHNDVMLAFGTPEKQILIEPIFAQWIQSTHGKTSYGFDVLLSSTSSPAFNAGPGDFLVHHAITLGLHTTTLILVKGDLDARGFKLMPDKKDFGYSFPCDGPGRGGTCDISAWDAFYFAVFWMLNTIGWGNVSQFQESSTYLMGWLRDYLWLNSSQLINGYNPFGMNSLSVWTWMFLFEHLVWATRFMFLISWHGYWQESIETLAWAHERTPLANFIRWRDKPVALSIIQARLVGLAHFSIGYIFTYAAFLIASTSGKFELITETLGYLDTYFVKWFTHVCCQKQQDPVGKDEKIFSFL